MPYSRAQKKSVYIEWGTIFSSYDNSKLRKQKAIRTVVRYHQPFSDEFNPNLVGILQSLLEDGTIQFYNDSKARRSFPELFRLPPGETRKEATSNTATTNTMSKTAHEGESQKRLLASLDQYETQSYSVADLVELNVVQPIQQRRVLRPHCHVPRDVLPGA